MWTVEPPHGPVLISADVHGNWDDFARLRELFLQLSAAGRDPVWISVGDWVHGPDGAGRRGVTTRDGEQLYDYADRTPEILAGLFALMDAHPGRVGSLLGNHEHAHIGGRRTRKFHDDEAAALEARMTAAEVADLRARFRDWPMIARVVACNVIVTHGALAPVMQSWRDLERVQWDGGAKNDELAAELMSTGLTRYGFNDGEGCRAAGALGRGRRPGGSRTRSRGGRLGRQRHARGALVFVVRRAPVTEGVFAAGSCAALPGRGIGARRRRAAPTVGLTP